MNKRKNNLDEMQEQKLLKIEHYGVWFAFWGLLAAIMVQVVLATDVKSLFRNIVGEWLVFMCLAIYLLISCLINGIWDRRLKPNFKTNILASLLSGTVCGVIFFASSYYKYAKLAGSVATGIFMFVEVFVLTLGALTVTAFIYKKRVQKLEAEDKSTSDDAENR